MVNEKWTDDETRQLLLLWQVNKSAYARQKMVFYEAAARAITSKSTKSIKNRCEHLERKFLKVKAQFPAANGASDASVVRTAVDKAFKWFYALEAVVGRAPTNSNTTATASRNTTAPTSAAETASTAPTRSRAAVHVHPAGPVAFASVATPPRPLGRSRKNPSPVTRSSPRITRPLLPARVPPPVAIAMRPSTNNTVEILDTPPASSEESNQVLTRDDSLDTTTVAEEHEAVGTNHGTKRKLPDDGWCEIVTGLSERYFELERRRLALLEKRFEFELTSRREEMAFRREQEAQRQREFELMYQTKHASE